MDSIIFYTIGCPACNVLKTKLDNKNIKYKTVTDKNEMINLGIDMLPCLYVNGFMMNFSEAIKWINSIESR